MKSILKQLAEIAKHINRFENVVVMSGTGLPTSAGIRNLNKALGTNSRNSKNDLIRLDDFKKKSNEFYQILRDYPHFTTWKPTVAHYFVRLLNKKGILLRNYTENVDGLDLLTGLPEHKLIELNGHVRSGSCLNCKELYPIEFMKEIVFENIEPKCKKCNSLIRPNMVFFGEELPEAFYEKKFELSKCDLLIILGTSLHFEPFASLAKEVPRSCPRLLINTENKIVPKIGYFDATFNPTAKIGDVFYKDNVNEGCKKLIELFGWKKDLETLLNEKINTEGNVINWKPISNDSDDDHPYVLPI